MFGVTPELFCVEMLPCSSMFCENDFIVFIEILKGP